MSNSDDLRQYDYSLPPELIAKEPLPQRDASRLMVVDRASTRITHHVISDLPDLLSPGDCLVFNNSRVLPARLIGRRTASNGKWEGLYLGRLDNGFWHLIGQTRGKLEAGETITLEQVHGVGASKQLVLTLVEKHEDGAWVARPESDRDAHDILEEFGTVPLPPYMHRKVATHFDWQRYQTVYATEDGSVAAPTAGLHFTEELLAECTAHGLTQVFVTLHVGMGTFQPISVASLDQHQMHTESCELSDATASHLTRTRESGGRVVAVGTTSARTVESAAVSGSIQAVSGVTDLFIRPPYQFRAVEALLTNFHLPRSSLFILVSTMAGRELIQRAYHTAIQDRYRFYSYGDAMLIL